MNKGFTPKLCRKCLYTSISFDDMVRFAGMAYPDYDIYESSGYPRGYPISSQDAADRIVADMIQDGYYVDFIETLAKIGAKGFMGRPYIFKDFDDVIDDVIEAGYSYDEETYQFFEDQSQQISRNWGRLLEGDERQMAVLRLDIAGNSILVKENPKPLIDKAYNDLREIVSNAVVSRFGRLWIWEGDGSLGVFMVGNYSRMAILAGIDIINEMFIYNKMRNPLNSVIKLRISVHSGDLIYSENDIKCLKAETVRKATSLESKAAVPNSLVISESLALSQDQSILNLFSNAKSVSSEKYRIYQVSQDKE